MPYLDIILLVGAGLLGGAANALAGGGTFFTFPAMIEVGLPPVAANASNAVALYPGRFPSFLAGWSDLAPVRHRLVRSCAIAAAGSVLGAWLLLETKDRVFTGLVPWLLLFATALFAFGHRLVPLFRRLAPQRGARGTALASAVIFEVMVAIYGGYFGAGAGFMVLAANTITGIADLRASAALKNLLITIMSSVSVIIFIAAGAVIWRETLVMIPGALVGGYVGARLLQVLHPGRLKAFILAVAVALTAYYFIKLYA